MRALPPAILVAVTSVASAQNAITVTDVRVDRATLHTAGIQVLISGDDDRDATVAVRVDGVDALPLFRVRPETVTGRTVPAQFAGTVFDLSPGATYAVTLDLVDPDGGDTTRALTVTTRALPRDPAMPRAVAVASVAELQAALAAAQPGDVITLADGTYAGSFGLAGSGTADAPIVIRGASQSGVILDGDGCDCNVLEVSGSHVHVERLTIRNGTRGLRFLGTGTTRNVVRRVVIENVVHGIGSGVDQTDFTICDNVIAGRLAWPLIASDDGALHNDDQGIRVDGSGHVVCHNDLTGFGDPLLNFAEGGRAYDFYGNDIHETYGDGTELDRAEGNARLFHNRFTNQYTAISIQPAYGGPVYVLRNQVVNTVDEQIKLKSVGGTIEPSGALILHNTFISPRRALNLQTPITQHDSALVNNLFIGPAAPDGRNVEWTAALDAVDFDHNGYFPDLGYWLGSVGGTPRSFATLAAAQQAGVERNGVVLQLPPATPPASSTTTVDRTVIDVAVDGIDRGYPVPGINRRHASTAPDLGAREAGCPPPVYGPRPAGSEAATNKIDCAADDVPPGSEGPVGGDELTPGDRGGGCCQSSTGGTSSLLLGALLAIRMRSRRRSTGPRTPR